MVLVNTVVAYLLYHAQCTVCEEVFPDASQLRSHMRSHADDRPFMCAECGNQFTRQGHLRRHMNLHSGNKPFACNMCACQFTRVDHLRRHIKLQHVADDWPEPFPGMAAGGDEIAIKSEVDDDVEADEEVDSTVVEVSAEDCVSRDVRCSSETLEINELYSLSRTCDGQLPDKPAFCSFSETAVGL